MANNKKKLKSAKKVQSNLAADELLKSSQKGGLSPPQLTALVFLALGASWVIEYWAAATNEGAFSKACSKYYQTSEPCTEVDAFVIRTKFHSSIISFVLVLVTTLLCWYDDKLLQSLNYCLCASPIALTIGVLAMSEGCNSNALVPDEVNRVVFVGIALIALAVVSSAVGTASLKKPQLNSLYDSSWMSFALAIIVEAMSFAKGGVEGYTNANPTDITDGAECAVNFIAIDKATIAALVAFGLYFFDESRKNTMMFVIALSNLAKLFFQLPEQEAGLRDPEMERKVLFGTAIFTGVLSFLPSRYQKHASTLT